MTLREICAVLAQRDGKPFDETFFRQAAVEVLSLRATFIRQRLQRHPYERRSFVQSIGLNMEPVKQEEWPKFYRKLLVSKQEVPSSLHASGILYDFVGSPQGGGSMGLAEAGQLEYLLYLPGAEKKQYYFMLGRKLYSWNNASRKLRVDFVAENPRDLMAFELNGEPCWNDELDLPMPESLMSIILGSNGSKD